MLDLDIFQEAMKGRPLPQGVAEVMPQASERRACHMLNVPRSSPYPNPAWPAPKGNATEAKRGRFPQVFLGGPPQRRPPQKSELGPKVPDPFLFNPRPGSATASANRLDPFCFALRASTEFLALRARSSVFSA